MNLPNLARSAAAALLLAASSPLLAQPDYRDEPRVFRHQIQLQAYHFENFFQARGGVPEEDVNAIGFEYSTAYRLEETGPDVFGALYATNYDSEDTNTSFGGRLGMSRYGTVHSFYAYVDHLVNGYAFDVEETTANADITSLFGLYSYRINPDWQVGLSTYNERTDFDVDTGYEGTYNQLEGEARYRGFGRIFEPRIGYAIGQRDVDNDRDSYDHRHWFVQLDTRPHPSVDVSLRYRYRTRDYKTIARSEDRPQLLLRANFRQSERFSWQASFTHEDVNSSVPGRDFETSRLFAGFTVGF